MRARMVPPAVKPTAGPAARQSARVASRQLASRVRSGLRSSGPLTVSFPPVPVPVDSKTLLSGNAPLRLDAPLDQRSA